MTENTTVTFLVHQIVRGQKFSALYMWGTDPETGELYKSPGIRKVITRINLEKVNDGYEDAREIVTLDKLKARAGAIYEGRRELGEGESLHKDISEEEISKWFGESMKKNKLTTAQLEDMKARLEGADKAKEENERLKATIEALTKTNRKSFKASEIEALLEELKK